MKKPKKRRKPGPMGLGLDPTPLVIKIAPRHRRRLERLVRDGHASSLGGAIRWLIDREEGR